MGPDQLRSFEANSYLPPEHLITSIIYAQREVHNFIYNYIFIVYQSVRLGHYFYNCT